MNEAHTARLTLLARLITHHHTNILNPSQRRSKSLRQIEDRDFYKQHIEDPTPIIYAPFHEWDPSWLKYHDHNHFTFIQFGEYHSTTHLHRNIRALSKIYSLPTSSEMANMINLSNIPKYECPQLHRSLDEMRRFPFHQYPSAMIYYATKDGKTDRVKSSSIAEVSINDISYMAVRLPFTSDNIGRSFVVHTLRPGVNLYRDVKANKIDNHPHYFQLYPEYSFSDQLQRSSKQENLLHCHQYMLSIPLRLVDFNQTPLFDIESRNVSNYNYTQDYPSDRKIVEPIFKCRRTYGCTDIRFGKWKGTMLTNYNRRIFINLLMYGSSTHFIKSSSLWPMFNMLTRYLHIDGIISNMEWVIHNDTYRQLGTEIFIGNESVVRRLHKVRSHNHSCKDIRMIRHTKSNPLTGLVNSKKPAANSS
jgi:hypothetical protein